MKLEHPCGRYAGPAAIEAAIKIEKDLDISGRNTIHSNLLCFAGLE